MRKSFIFYNSFYEAIKDLDKKDRAELFEAICELGLNNNEIKLTGMNAILFKLIKPQLLANTKRYEDGKKGGRPTKEEDIKPVINFKKTSGYENKKPNNNNNVNNNANVNLNKNANLNANVNDNVNENINSDFEILSYIESNFGITINGTHLLKIEELLKIYNDEILCYGIDKCIENNAKTLNYFYKVIENWKQCNFKTIEEVKIGRRIF